jgi:hypothetical protein
MGTTWEIWGQVMELLHQDAPVRDKDIGIDLVCSQAFCKRNTKSLHQTLLKTKY